ncbi:hypothetical protein HPP92_006528 [Vanilla planifolia]|uniref:Uncharacterized protein n=1 Tax=Vanilla planifolia TaxID=51239 RepID=A0A835RIW3_VANPL|nr:hypothetical protein HPP92_006528 [Vanilla planifolia]
MEKDKVMKCYEVIQDMQAGGDEEFFGFQGTTNSRIFLKKTMDEALQRRGSFNYSKSTKYGATWSANTSNDHERLKVIKESDHPLCFFPFD